MYTRHQPWQLEIINLLDIFSITGNLQDEEFEESPPAGSLWYLGDLVDDLLFLNLNGSVLLRVCLPRLYPPKGIGFLELLQVSSLSDISSQSSTVESVLIERLVDCDKLSVQDS